MKSFLKKYLPFAILMAAFTSCNDDLLHTEPRGVLAEGVLSATSVDKLGVAAYQALGGHFFGNDESFAGPSSNWIIDVHGLDLADPDRIESAINQIPGVVANGLFTQRRADVVITSGRWREPSAG